MLGSVFLKDRYSIYDLEQFKMALGPVFDFDAPPANDGIEPDESS